MDAIMPPEALQSRHRQYESGVAQGNILELAQSCGDVAADVLEGEVGALVGQLCPPSEGARAHHGPGGQRGQLQMRQIGTQHQCVAGVVPL